MGQCALQAQGESLGYTSPMGQCVLQAQDESLGLLVFDVCGMMFILLPSDSGRLPGGLAQLARALAWHARGHRFDPDILHFAPLRA